MASEKSHIASLASSATAYIYDTFRVTEVQAKEMARGMLDLISAKGGDPAAFTSDRLRELIEGHLGPNLEWRDDATKQAAAQRRKSKVDAYNALLDSQRRSPFKKW